MKELSPGERKQEFFLTGKPTRIIFVQIIGFELSMSRQWVVYVGTMSCARREHVGSTMILNRTKIEQQKNKDCCQDFSWDNFSWFNQENNRHHKSNLRLKRFERGWTRQGKPQMPQKQPQAEAVPQSISVRSIASSDSRSCVVASVVSRPSGDSRSCVMISAVSRLVNQAASVDALCWFCLVNLKPYLGECLPIFDNYRINISISAKYIKSMCACFRRILRLKPNGEMTGMFISGHLLLFAYQPPSLPFRPP